MKLNASLLDHLTSPFSEVVPNKISVVKRLSGIIRNIASSRTSVINQKDSKNQSPCCRKDSSSSNGPTFSGNETSFWHCLLIFGCALNIVSDSSLYQRISPCPQNLQRMTCTSESILNGVGWVLLVFLFLISLLFLIFTSFLHHST